MFWFFNKNISNVYNFAQIFEFDNFIVDNDNIFKLNCDKTPIISGKNYLEIIEKNNIKPLILNLTIKIIGNKISFCNIDTSENFCFEKNDKVIKPETNTYNKLIIDFEYKVIDKTKMPELLESFYDYYYQEIQVQLFQINSNIIMVKEFNATSKTNKNYIVAKKT